MSAISTYAHTVARTTLDQLGGAGRLSAMTGAREFFHFSNPDGSGVRFRFAGSSTVGNVCHITLAWDDTYTVAFYYCRGIKSRKVADWTGVYADSLRGLFERHTGLYLSL